ncbi:hypothetical protein Pla52n_70800 [Stieleria varia]|uniref:Uncharacterized protein n=1 Tax=Stieleria varia TaxID=2528005 RepID=A0A5C5ZHB4_9BACT|nr:hypothetical protein Pla52n_70800 [Stieleria varia]
MENREFQEKYEERLARISSIYDANMANIHRVFWESVRRDLLIPDTRRYLTELPKRAAFPKQGDAAIQVGMAPSTYSDGVRDGSMKLSKFQSLHLLVPYQFDLTQVDTRLPILCAFRRILEMDRAPEPLLTPAIIDFLRTVVAGWNHCFRSQPGPITRRAFFDSLASRIGLVERGESLDLIVIAGAPIYRIIVSARRFHLDCRFSLAGFAPPTRSPPWRENRILPCGRLGEN